MYDEEWNDFQFSFLGLNAFTIVENAKSANVKGLELSGSYRVTDQLTLSGGLTAQDPKLDANFCGPDPNGPPGSVLQHCSDTQAQAVHGSQLPYSPHLKGSFTARYEFDVAGWQAHLQGTAAFVSGSPVGLLTIDSTGTNQVQELGRLPGFVTGDFSMGADRNNISFELFVKNVSDTRGQQNRYVSCTVGVCTNTYVVPNQPRTIGIRLSQKF